ncbi:Mechanosensitive ion channel protein 4 [Linum grandiflorum]
MSASSSDRRELLLNMNGTSPAAAAPPGNIWRESSYDFFQGVDNDRKRDTEHEEAGNESYRFDFNPTRGTRNNAGPAPTEEDPPSKLIGQFLHKQQASGDFSLDMDLEMAELQNGDGDSLLQRNLAPVSESPVALHQRVSFETSESLMRRQAARFNGSPGIQSNAGSPAAVDGAEVVKCSSRGDGSFSSNSSFKRKSNLFKERTKSRLMDPPLPQQQQPTSQTEKSGRMPGKKSGQLKSGFVGRSSHIDEEEDDPLLEEDLPEGLSNDKLGIWTILEWVSLILLIAAFVCSLTIPKLKTKVLWNLPLWKWEVMVLVLICGRLVSGWVIRFIVFFIERNFLLRKRVLYFVYGIKKPVQNCLWLGLVLIAWHFLFDKKVEKETGSRSLRYVTKVLLCLVVGTLLWLVKTLVVKVLASSFHMSTYFDRIQESLFNQYVIETLSGPPLIEIQKNEEEEERLVAEMQKLHNAGIEVPPALKAVTCPSPQPNRLIGSGRLQKSPRVGTPRASGAFANTDKEGEDAITIDHLHKLNHKNVSAWNMKRLMNIIRHGTLSTLDEQIKDSSHDDDESTTKIRSEYEAKAAARKIFQNVAKPGSRYIYFEDLLRFMEEDEATKAMSFFEGASESQKISKSCLKNWVVNAFRDRRALALTLNDTKTAVNKLHRVVNVLVAILIIIIWLLMLGIATTKFLLFLSSQLVLVAFIFGNTCKTVFEAIVFLFVMHPFDVGDRCEIDGVQMIVEEMNILTTIFLRFDNQKIIIPNSVLATKSIGNYYRSPDMGDGIEFFVHVATPTEKIAAVRQRINAYIENKKEHWYPSPLIILKEADGLNRVRIAIWPTHKMNHQDMGERYARRSLLIEEMVKIFKELDMQYRLLPLDINVRALPPVSSERVPPSWAA